MPQADLEISLYRRDAGGDNGSYGVELRFGDSQNEAEQRQGGLNPVHFDPIELRQRMLDPAAYGQYLAAQLLAEPDVRSLFDRAVVAAQAQDVPLRLRLNIAPGAPETPQPALGDIAAARGKRALACRRQPALLPLPF